MRQSELNANEAVVELQLSNEFCTSRKIGSSEEEHLSRNDFRVARLTTDRKR